MVIPQEGADLPNAPAAASGASSPGGPGRVPTRREFLATVCASALVGLGCGFPNDRETQGGGSARLTARPAAPTGSITSGQWPLQLGDPRDGILLVPAGYDPAQPLPLLLALHGAGIGASGPIDFLGPYAEENKFLLLSPAARSNTWDAITGRYGPDVAFIDAALNLVFSKAAVDPARVFAEGFSDGASYALGLGLANGDLFHKVVAFSPGFIPRSDTVAHGRPDFFVSHGKQDPILPIDVSSRRIVPELRDQGYTVEYVEYDGEHSVPPAIAQQAVAWLLG